MEMTNKMTPERARELMEKATPGPWMYWQSGCGPAEVRKQGDGDRFLVSYCHASWKDAAFISALPDITEAYLELATENEQLRAELASYKKHYEQNDA
jgi:hypothetical protein